MTPLIRRTYSFESRDKIKRERLLGDITIEVSIQTDDFPKGKQENQKIPKKKGGKLSDAVMVGRFFLPAIST